LTILIPQNDPGDVAFHCGGAVGQGESVGDGLLVAADAGSEGAQFGLVVGLDPGEPAVQFLLAAAAGHHLGEASGMPGEGVQVRAAIQDAGQLGPLPGIEAGRAGQQPAGDLAGGGDDRSGRRSGGHRAERPHVAFHRLHAALPAFGLQFGVQGCGAGDPLIPPLPQVGLVPVELAWPGGGLD
jgi:hypothetical protein